MASLEAKLRYVPIVMPVDMHANYKERSKLNKKQKIYDCAPQLNYEIFVNGSIADSIKEYARGIETCIPHLGGIGLDEGQSIELRDLIAKTVELAISQIK